MSLSGIILGVINVAIVVAILLLVGAIILWFCSWIGFAVPDMVQKLYIAVVALIALYMLVALLFGLPPGFRVIGFWPGAAGIAGATAATISTGTAADLRQLLTS